MRSPGWRSWLAREIHNLEVAGSIPAPGTFCHNTLLWRSWQRFGLMSRWPRVRAPAGASFGPRISHSSGWMAEWSKALVLGTSLSGGVGSNPTPVTFGRRGYISWGISSIGRVRRSQRRGTGIETRILHFCMGRAQRAAGRSPWAAGQASLVMCSYSLVVRTPRCGRGNPGSNPGRGITYARVV